MTKRSIYISILLISTAYLIILVPPLSSPAGKEIFSSSILMRMYTQEIIGITIWAGAVIIFGSALLLQGKSGIGTLMLLFNAFLFIIGLSLNIGWNRHYYPLNDPGSINQNLVIFWIIFTFGVLIYSSQRKNN